MIYLHQGDNAKERIRAVVENSGGEVLELVPEGPLGAHLEEVTGWLSRSGSPGLIVVDPASAADTADRDAFEALRRMAKFKGVDVHLNGDETLEFVADRVLRGDEDFLDAAPGSEVGPRITELVHSEHMTPLEPARMDIPAWQEIVAMTGCSEQDARGRVEWMKEQKVWANNLYQVNVSYLPGNRAHIMIRRLDRQPIHNWQHFQEIKNQVLGAECEAVEVYPKESMLVDAKHHYHLWGFTTPERSFGIGFDMGRQVAGD